MSMDIWAKLGAPFDPSLISWRPGSTNKDKTKALALAYLDARDIMERLDRVLGPENWEDRYKQAGSSIICELRIRIETANGLEWITKSDGSGESDIEGSKGAISGALKRAAVKFGIGRYLYYVPDWWYPIEQGKWFTREAKDKMTRDLGAWQRDYFSMSSSQPMNQPQRVEPPKQQPQPAPTPSINGVPVTDKELDEAFKEFLKELTHANTARREEHMGPVKGEDIVEALSQQNFRNIPDPFTNWACLKQMGIEAIKAMTNELANKPTLIGSTVTF